MTTPNQDHDQALSFVTFGMFIVDEIEWQIPNPPAPKTNLIGGAGTYAVLGARLAVSSSLTLPRTISWIVDVGSDFPDEVKQTIDTWATKCIFRHDHTRLTTRAWNGYGANDLRAFKYLTPKVRLEVSSLNGAQIMANSFHMVCSPDRCLDITSKLREARRAIDPDVPDPVIVWEPIPDLCSPEQLVRLQEAGRNCTIISPNHDELKMFFPDQISSTETQKQLVARLLGIDKDDDVEKKFSASRYSNIPSVIVREGNAGSTVYIPVLSHKQVDNRSISISSHQPFDSHVVLTNTHFPAYHTPTTSSQVTDPTGGGNTYLGALAVILGLLSTNTISSLPTFPILQNFFTESSGIAMPENNNNTTRSHTDTQNTRLNQAYANIYALIAASFAIEQNGTPVVTMAALSTLTSTSAETGVPTSSASDSMYESKSNVERWNGETVESRIRRYLEREGEEIRRTIWSTK